MVRPPAEVADVVRLAGRRFIDDNRHWLNRLHLKVLTAIERCRTAALGGHVDRCTACGHKAISYNSCRNRHCPRCQANARDRWIEARSRDLLPVPYAHVVFTLPHEFAPLALQNKKVAYDILFRASAETLIEVARNPERLGADIGFFSVLHTWNQKLEHHPHVHCVVPAGGLAPDRSRWIASHSRFLLPVAVLKQLNFRVEVMQVGVCRPVSLSLRGNDSRRYYLRSRFRYAHPYHTLDSATDSRTEPSEWKPSGKRCGTHRMSNISRRLCFCASRITVMVYSV